MSQPKCPKCGALNGHYAECPSNPITHGHTSPPAEPQVVKPDECPSCGSWLGVEAHGTYCAKREPRLQGEQKAYSGNDSAHSVNEPATQAEGKAREWWINTLTCEVHVGELKGADGNVRVIERSAYDALAKKLRKAKAALEEIKAYDDYHKSSAIARDALKEIE